MKTFMINFVKVFCVCLLMLAVLTATCIGYLFVFDCQSSYHQVADAAVSSIVAGNLYSFDSSAIAQNVYPTVALTSTWADCNCYISYQYYNNYSNMYHMTHYARINSANGDYHLYFTSGSTYLTWVAGDFDIYYGSRVQLRTYNGSSWVNVNSVAGTYIGGFINDLGNDSLSAIKSMLLLSQSNYFALDYTPTIASALMSLSTDPLCYAMGFHKLNYVSDNNPLVMELTDLLSGAVFTYSALPLAYIFREDSAVSSVVVDSTLFYAFYPDILPVNEPYMLKFYYYGHDDDYLELPSSYDQIWLYMHIDNDYGFTQSSYTFDDILTANHNALSTNGSQSSYLQGYNDGYNVGINANDGNNLINVCWSVMQFPFTLLFGTYDPVLEDYRGGLFNFVLLGIDMRPFVLSILTLCVIVGIIRTIIGARR